MGRYHHFVVIVNETIYQWTTQFSTRGCGPILYEEGGSKLGEHGYIDNEYMLRVERYLSPGGRWHKLRLVNAGDSGCRRENDFGMTLYEMTSQEEITNVVSASGKPFYAELIHTTREDICDHYPGQYRFAVNHDKKLFVDMAKLTSKVHPLGILTCEPCVDSSFLCPPEEVELVGSWARDRISMEASLPPDDEFTEVPFHYRDYE
jgi:hypothetical protein